MHSHTFNRLLLTFIVIVCIGLVQLGNWQLRRLQWKTGLIERIEQRVNAIPVAAPLALKANDINAEQHEYLRVRVSGEFLHEQETLVWAATEYGTGFWVVTPLVTGDFTVLINRGFIPAEARDPASRSKGQLRGEQQLKGLLRLSEPKGALLRNNLPQENRWYSRDVMAIASARNLEKVAPFFIDAEKQDITGGLPISGLTRIKFRNSHLVYALTWYGLALLLAAMTIWSSLKIGNKDN